MTVEEFYSHEPLVEDYWRGIILFGTNVTSYKFALAKALLEINPQLGQLLKLADIAPSFLNYVTERLKLSDKQATSRSSKYLDACQKYNWGEIDQKKLIEETVRYGFVIVINAFHVIGSGEIDRRFYIDERTTNRGIRITDEFSELAESLQSKNFHHEIESRWRLVETAWELKVSRG